MSRTRIVFTLILVATVAMLLGFVVSTLVVRSLAPDAPDARPAATEPPRPADTIVDV